MDAGQILRRDMGLRLQRSYDIQQVVVRSGLIECDPDALVWIETKVDQALAGPAHDLLKCLVQPNAYRIEAGTFSHLEPEPVQRRRQCLGLPVNSLCD